MSDDPSTKHTAYSARQLTLSPVEEWGMDLTPVEVVSHTLCQLELNEQSYGLLTLLLPWQHAGSHGNGFTFI